MTALEAAINELINCSFFTKMSRQQITDLCQSGTIATSCHREVLFQSGDEATHFGIVLSGAYKLVKQTFSGEDVIVHFAIPGDVIGAFIMTQAKPTYPVTVVAMGSSRFVKIPKATYLQQWSQAPELIFRIQNSLSERMELSQSQKALSKSSLAQKVGILLLNLKEKNTNPDLWTLPLPLTRKEIADCLGASVESVIRVMSDWSKKGIIATTDQQISILKPEMLVEEIHRTQKEF